MKTYDEVAAILRKHAEFKPADGWAPFGGLYGYHDDTPLPRQVIYEKWANRYNHAMPDLWVMGLELVLKQTTNWYQLDLIGGYPDRCGFSVYGGDDEQYVDDLEKKAARLHTVEHGNSYLLKAHGLHSCAVFLLAEWPDTALYKVDLYEGEGWWGTFFFGLRTAFDAWRAFETVEGVYGFNIPAHGPALMAESRDETMTLMLCADHEGRPGEVLVTVQTGDHDTETRGWPDTAEGYAEARAYAEQLRKGGV